MPNEFNDCWVEDDAVLAHIYVNCSDTSTPVRFSNLHHFGGGSSAYPSRCMIVNSGFVYLNTAFGQGTSYRNISGSISPFRVNTATNAHIWATDLVGNLVTDNKFIEDQTYSSNGLFNYVRMNNFGAVYGYSSHAVPNGEIADEWRKETDTHPFVRIAPTLGVGFGDGTAAPTAYIKGAANVISTSGSTTLFDVGANWDGRHLLLGGYHLWVDGTGVLRIKFGAPTSATDGTVVGTQT
jgi:hypothetical protein